MYSIPAMEGNVLSLRYNHSLLIFPKRKYYVPIDKLTLAVIE